MFRILKAIALGSFRHLVPQPREITRMVLPSPLFAVRSITKLPTFNQINEEA